MNNRIKKTEKDFEVVYDEPLQKTLYNRLDPKVMRNLDAIATRYPAIYRGIRNALTRNELWTSISMDTAFEMRTYLNIDLNEFHNYFE